MEDFCFKIPNLKEQTTVAGLPPVSKKKEAVS